MSPKTITIFKGSKAIHTEETKSKARRFSQRCASDQRQLKAALAANPGATSATIGECKFDAAGQMIDFFK